MGSQWSQFFPPAPTLAANDGDCQHGKVFFVIGDYSCIGLELAKMIYNKQTRVYLASRSGQAAMQAIKGIGIKASVEDFKAQETELHGLWNNAGSIRIIWYGSQIAELSSPPEGIIMMNCALRLEQDTELHQYKDWKPLSSIRENNGCYILPWGGVVEYVKGNLDNAIKSKEDGGSGAAQEFRELCEENTRDYR
ncbi:putative short-chain dehydrogenase [Seiridium cupressi]